MEPINDPLRDSFAFLLAEDEAVRRPEVPQRLTFAQVYPRHFTPHTAPFARLIVPLELVQEGDPQVVVHSRVGIHPMQPVSIDFLVDFPSVTSIVADQIVQARRPLPHIRELFVLNQFGTVDQQTLVNMPGLESLSLGSGFSTRRLSLEETETHDWDSDRLDLSVLESMPGLRNLRFNSFAVKSIAPLQYLRRLECLRIEGLPQPHKADPLAGLTALRCLGVENMKGLRCLGSLEDLECVEFYDPVLANLKAFKNWKRVTSMVLAGRGFKSLEGIQALSALEDLFLGRTGVSDLAPLEEAQGLRRLRLAHPDRIADFSPLRELTNLQELTIQMGSVAQLGHLPTIDFVTGLERLEKLEVIGAVIDDGSMEPLSASPS